METSSAYINNVNLLKQLHTTSDRQKMQAPFANDFEAIYKKAMEKDVKVDNAKSFVSSLSEDERYTLQKYTGLVDTVNTSDMSDEGAYNLLMHDYEKYDFNGDGAVQDGIGNMAPIIPAGMSDDIKSAYVSSLNSLGDGDRLMAMTLSFDMGRLTSQINGTPYKPEPINYQSLSSRVDSILNPTPPAFSSDEVKKAIKAFWDKFQAELTKNS